MQADEVEAFFAEQDELMNMPDDGLEDHIARLVSRNKVDRASSKATGISFQAPPKNASKGAPSFNLDSLDEQTFDRRHDNGKAVKRKGSDIQSSSKRRKSSSVEREDDYAAETGVPSAGIKTLKFPLSSRYSMGIGAPSQLERPISAGSSPSVTIDDISMFTEPSRLSLEDTASVPHGRIKPPPNKVPQNETGKRGSKKTLQYVQLQSTSAREQTEAPDVPSSPIEDPSRYLTPVLPPDVKRAPSKESSTQAIVPLQGAAKRVSSHAPAIKRDELTKPDSTKAGRSVSAAKSSRLRVSSPTLSAVSSCESEGSTSTVASVAGPSKQNTSKNKVSPTAEKAKPTNKGKKKAELSTPYEYALSLQQEVAVDAQGSSTKGKKLQDLKGMVFLYVSSDMIYASPPTKGRMNYLVKHGGTLLPAYDPIRLTHIVTEAAEGKFLRTLGLKSLDEIPTHIPIVKWSWVLVSDMSRRARSDRQSRDIADIEIDDFHKHAAFHISYAEARRRYQPSVRNAKKEAKNERKEGSSRDQEVARKDQKPNVSLSQDATSKTLGVPADVQALEPTRLATPPSSPQTSATPSEDQDGISKGSDGQGVDPLAEFYELARAEREAQSALLLSSGDEGRDDDDESDPGSEDERPKIRPPRRGFTCDKKQTQLVVSPNQDVVDKLEELMELHRSKPTTEDKWRVYSYSKCLRALRNYPTRIKTYSEALSINGVGSKTAQKIMEILNTGNLKRINYERTEDVEVTRLFQGIYGVGQSTAYKWYANGCRTLQDLRDGKAGVKLSIAQEIGLRFYDDINTRMPRSEAKALFEAIRPIALSIDPDLFVEIMGSYRRGKATCGDIDIMITRDPSDGKTHAGVLPILLAKLRKAGIITEDLALPEEDDEFEAIYRGLCRLPIANSRRRRIDFLTIPWSSRGAALLYYTGDDIFNRAMRYKAGVMGYSLNQKGLFSGVVRDPRDRRVKTNGGTLVASETEEEIFRILGVPWQEPHERVRG